MPQNQRPGSTNSSPHQRPQRNALKLSWTLFCATLTAVSWLWGGVLVVAAFGGAVVDGGWWWTTVSVALLAPLAIYPLGTWVLARRRSRGWLVVLAVLTLGAMALAIDFAVADFGGLGAPR